MSTIIKQLNKKSGVVYCYESESYWVPGVGPRSRRRCIGRLDPDTGEIVPTGRSGPRKQSQDATSSATQGQDQVSALKAELLRSAERIQQLEQSLAEQVAQNRQLAEQMAKVKVRLEKVLIAFDNPV